MTTSDHPFAGSAAAANGSQPPSQARLALDNLLRRELRVSDPNDAKAVATALMERYKNDPKTRAIQSEAQGLPFSTAPLSTVPVPAAASTSDGELGQAISDVERSLEDLTTNSLLNSVLPELRGWAGAIRSLIQEGSAAAAMALDVSQRDKAFGIRRSLGDFARLARLVGLLTPVVNANYRKLAQGLDEVRAVLLVKMGEAIAAGSFNGNRYLMQAPYTELQARRDAVMHALRNLVGSTQFAYDADTWPRGLDAYGDLYRELESRGQADLRALLNENELARIMDSLIQRAAHGESDGLRGLGATAQLDLHRFLRFIVVGKSIVKPKSPPMNTFLKALEVFRDAFTRSGGIRLLHIARPQVLFYGLYGSGEPSPGAERLQRLIRLRGNMASRLDCLSSCCVNDNKARTSLVALDKSVSELDRAIDILSLSSDENTIDAAVSPEHRVVAQGLELNFLYNNLEKTEIGSLLADVLPILRKASNSLLALERAQRSSTLTKDMAQEGESPSGTIKITKEERRSAQEELVVQIASEDEWEGLAKSVAPECASEAIFELIQKAGSQAYERLNASGDSGIIDLGGTENGDKDQPSKISKDISDRLRISSPRDSDISLEELSRHRQRLERPE